MMGTRASCGVRERWWSAEGGGLEGDVVAAREIGGSIHLTVKTEPEHWLGSRSCTCPCTVCWLCR